MGFLRLTVLRAVLVCILIGCIARAAHAWEVDGDPRKWGSVSRGDHRGDVAPLQVPQIDIANYDYSVHSWDCQDVPAPIYSSCKATGMRFILHFMGTPFAGQDTTTIDLVFDVDEGSEGDPSDFWGQMKPEYVEVFRPDVRVSIVGMGEEIMDVRVADWRGAGWELRDLSPLDRPTVAASGSYVEGQVHVDWSGRASSVMQSHMAFVARMAGNVDCVFEFVSLATAVSPSTWGQVKRHDVPDMAQGRGSP